MNFKNIYEYCILNESNLKEDLDKNYNTAKDIIKSLAMENSTISNKIIDKSIIKDDITSNVSDTNKEILSNLEDDVFKSIIDELSTDNDIINSNGTKDAEDFMTDEKLKSLGLTTFIDNLISYYSKNNEYDTLNIFIFNNKVKEFNIKNKTTDSLSFIDFNKIEQDIDTVTNNAKKSGKNILDINILSTLPFPAFDRSYLKDKSDKLGDAFFNYLEKKEGEADAKVSKDSQTNDDNNEYLENLKNDINSLIDIYYKENKNIDKIDFNTDIYDTLKNNHKEIDISTDSNNQNNYNKAIEIYKECLNEWKNKPEILMDNIRSKYNSIIDAYNELKNNENYKNLNDSSKAIFLNFVKSTGNILKVVSLSINTLLAIFMWCIPGASSIAAPIAKANKLVRYGSQLLVDKGSPIKRNNRDVDTKVLSKDSETYRKDDARA